MFEKKTKKNEWIPIEPFVVGFPLKTHISSDRVRPTVKALEDEYDEGQLQAVGSDSFQFSLAFVIRAGHC